MLNHLNILHSDWFIYNLREHCVPADFCKLRYVSKYYNKYITYNDVKITIVNNIYKRLRNILGSYYGKFMKYMEISGINISGIGLSTSATKKAKFLLNCNRPINSTCFRLITSRTSPC